MLTFQPLEMPYGKAFPGLDENALNFCSSAVNFNRNINGRTCQRLPMATLKGYQYATDYDINRNVCLGRRQLPAD